MEFLLGYLVNFKIVIILFLLLWIISIIGLCMAIDTSYDKESQDRNRAIRDRFVKKWPFMLILALLTCFPGPDDLWKIRISLIKYQLASPENVKKASDEIIQIGKKLECKYLGCEKK